jgi:hypothetical protein
MRHEEKQVFENKTNNGPRFLTNAPENQRPIFERAITESGFNIFIENEAYVNHKLQSGCIAIFTNEILGKDHELFWKTFYRIQKEYKSE